MARGGSFGRIGRLSPFGGGYGDLSKYSIAPSDSSPEQLDLYAKELGWKNGVVSDADYLAALQAEIDATDEGSKARMSAEDRLRDARYSIARAALVTRVNLAPSSDERISATQALITFDQQYLSQMGPGNQAYDDTAERIASEQADVRSTRYSALVDAVNAGQASTDDLIALASQLAVESGTGPDADTWHKTIGDLAQRKSDELLSDQMRAYQNGDLSGPDLLAYMDKQLAAYDPGSPRYKDLSQQRDDLAKSVRQATISAADDAKYKAWQAGTISDDSWVLYLQHRYDSAPAGSAEKVAYGDKLKEYTFSLTEDRLTYQVQHKTQPASALVAFYRAAQVGLNHGSQRWRQLQDAIEQWSKYGTTTASGGGGGGAGWGTLGSDTGNATGGIPGPGKVLGQPPDFTTLTRQKGAPPQLADLLRLDPTNSLQNSWWDKNLRSIRLAAQHGDATWTFYDRSGKPTVLPYTPGMLTELDARNVDYAYTSIAHASTPAKRMTAVGDLITALDQQRSQSRTMVMEDYQRAYTLLSDEKQRALGAGRWADYLNLAFQQQDLIRYVLGLPDNAPTPGPDDIGRANQNPLLDTGDLKTLSGDLGAIIPRNDDPNSPGYSYGVGDPVLGLAVDGSMKITARNADGSVADAEPDPNKLFVTQQPDGSLKATVVGADPSEWTTVVQADGTTITVPAYTQDNVHIVIDSGGEPQELWQPKAPAGANIPIYLADSAGYPTGGGGLLGSGPIPLLQSSPLSVPDTSAPTLIRPGGAIGGLGMQTISVVEDNRGRKERVNYYSLDGATWMRVLMDAGNRPPVVVLTLGTHATYKSGKLQIDGKDYDPAVNGPLSEYVHWYGPGDSLGGPNAPAWGVGAPGQFFETSTVDPGTGLMDTRSAARSGSYGIIPANEHAMMGKALQAVRDRQTALDAEAARFGVTPSQVEAMSDKQLIAASRRAYQKENPAQPWISAPQPWTSAVADAANRVVHDFTASPAGDRPAELFGPFLRGALSPVPSPKLPIVAGRTAAVATGGQSTSQTTAARLAAPKVSTLAAASAPVGIEKNRAVARTNAIPSPTLTPKPAPKLSIPKPKPKSSAKPAPTTQVTKGTRPVPV